MPSFPDTALLVLLALLLFGPKKLPVLARQLGKLMADFRRASNEFRAQMEEELRIAEQAERQKQVAAVEAAAPATPAIAPAAEATLDDLPPASETGGYMQQDYPADFPAEGSPETAAQPAPEPLPIATSGDLSIMPPSTGLPVPNTPPANAADTTRAHESELETETLHG